MVGANDDKLQHNLTQISKILSKEKKISITAVHKHKEALLKKGYIVKAPGRSFWDRGPNGKFIEKIELNKELNKDGVTVSIREDTVRTHLQGGVQFIVTKVGDLLEFEYRPRDGPNCFVPFLEEKPYNTHNNNEFYRGWLKMPRKSWGCRVIYQHTPTKDFLYIFPPQVDLTADELKSLDENDYPLYFFQKDIYDLTDFLEKWPRWKFWRKPGSSKPFGDTKAPVEFGYTNKVLNRTIPKGIKAVVNENNNGPPDTWIDESPGELEVESYQIKNTLSLLKNADIHDELYEKHNRIEGILSHIYDLLEEMAMVQESEIEVLRMKDQKERLEKAKQKTLDDHRGYE